MNKKNLVVLAGLMILALVIAGCSGKSGAAVADAGKITVFKSPTCGCCEKYIAGLKQTGYDVEVKPRNDMEAIKAEHNIPRNLQSCHTSIVGNYFIEGHVPLEAVKKLLEEKPDIDGIALPGMPPGSLGMPGAKTGTWTIYAIKDGESSEFMKI